jgi:hypothetical protein
MIVKNDDEVQNTLSWVFRVEYSNDNYLFNWQLVYWLNSWITSGDVDWWTTDLITSPKLDTQYEYITLSKNWWIEKRRKKFDLNFSWETLEKIKNLIIKNIWEIQKWKEYLIEFSIVDFNSNPDFKLLQKNII